MDAASATPSRHTGCSPKAYVKCFYCNAPTSDGFFTKALKLKETT